MFDTLGELLGRKVIFSDETGLTAVLAISHRAKTEEGAAGFGFCSGQMMSGKTNGDPSGDKGDMF